MKILYIGNSDRNGYSYYQYKIINQIYQNAILIDIEKIFGKFFKIINAVAWHVSPIFFTSIILKYLKKKIKEEFDIIYIHNVNLIDKNILYFLKKVSKKIVFYCADNPFEKRDKNRWCTIRPILKYFDLIIFLQKKRIIAAKKFGIKNSIYIPPTFKFNEFSKRNITPFEKKKYTTDIIWIATWFKERGELLKDILDNGLKIKVYGDRWHKDKNFNKIKHVISKGVYDADKYRKLIQCAKIGICLPSEENRDDITNRSLEIPIIGTLLLAKKTKTHKELFVENKEAVFFKKNKECVQKCIYLLNNKKIIKKIAKKGRLKILKNKKKLLFSFNIKIVLEKINKR
jgi:hypothetical protein